MHSEEGETGRLLILFKIIKFTRQAMTSSFHFFSIHIICVIHFCVVITTFKHQSTFHFVKNTKQEVVLDLETAPAR